MKKRERSEKCSNNNNKIDSDAQGKERDKREKKIIKVN